MTWQNFWWLMTWAVVIWYSVVTVYVTVKGAFDIRNMLAHLSGHGLTNGEP